VILDYNTLDSRLTRAAFVGLDAEPRHGFYVGYNDDLNYDSLHPFTRQIVPASAATDARSLSKRRT
jgi:hypothetical protein